MKEAVLLINKEIDKGIITLVQSKFREKLGIEVKLCKKAKGPYRIELRIEKDRNTQNSGGYTLRIEKNRTSICSANKPGLLAGIGHYLRMCIKKQSLVKEPIELKLKPAIPWRMIYAPGHFRNSYEVASKEEIKELMQEMALWGINMWEEWFDTNDLTNPYGSEIADSHIPKLFWENKKDILLAAQEVGLAIDLWLTPNHVFIDQVKDDIIAEKRRPENKSRFGPQTIIGNLVCPSKPKAREIILNNYKTLFADLKKTGIKLDLVSFGFYDNGGCFCDACHPWTKTSLLLDKEITDILHYYYPDCAVDLCGWLLTGEEIEIIKKWYSQGKLDGVKSLQIVLSGGSRDVKPMKQIKGLKRGLFVNLGYSENANDVYGSCGAVVAPGRLKQIIKDAAEGDCFRMMGYSEGIHNDINKVLMAQLSFNPQEDPLNILEDYSCWYFGLFGKDTKLMVKALKKMEFSAFKDNSDLESELWNLSQKMGEQKNSWRFQELFYRVKLCSLDSKFLESFCILCHRNIIKHYIICFLITELHKLV